MGFLSRSPRAARPAPARRPRVRLRREELRQSNALQPLERKIGYALAGAGFLGLVGVRSVGGLEGSEYGYLAFGAVLFAALAWCSWKTNRFAAGLASVACSFAPWGAAVLAGYPFLFFMMFLMMRMSSGRRKIMEARIAAGDLGNDEAPPARRRKGTAEPVEDPAVPVKPYAPASKRYTPPKHRGRTANR